MPVYGELPRFNQKLNNIRVENLRPMVSLDVVRHCESHKKVSHSFLRLHGFRVMGCLFSDNTWYFLYGHSLFTSPVNINCSHVLSTPNVL
jgi:hypothetical protein